MKSKRLEIILTAALAVLVISAFATTWTQSTNLVNNLSLGMSADGRIICAVPSTSYAVISTNWGQTWTVATNASNAHSGLGSGVAVSADGSKIFIPSNTNGSELLVSTDYGNTWLAWLKTNSPGAGPVACSADGTKLLAAIGGGMFVSTNGGANWYTSSVPAGFWSLASSADGKLMVGAVYGGKIYYSTNFGAAWAPTNLPAEQWDAVCVSSDGKWVGATSSYTLTTYISSNVGHNWMTNHFGGQSIACSANGTNWIIGGQTNVYTSLDGGVTWQTSLPGTPVSWYGSAVSADGSEFMIVGFPGIWAGHNTPSPQLNIQPADQAVALSWLIPSTNFVLQQNSDLTTTSWTDVSNSPVLNFTNLQQQVSVPSSPSNNFFRLIAQ